MRLAALVVAGLVAMSGSAFAQYIPRPMAPVGSSSAQDAVEIVQAMGLDPIGPAMRSGPFYVQSARDDFGRVLRVTVDARRSQVVAVEPGVPRALYGPDAGYVPQYPLHRGPDFALAPPGSVMAPHAQPPQTGLPPAAQPKPAAKSTAITPGRPPVPRKRPPSAPQEAAGSVEPLQAAPQPASPAAAPKPAAPAMPPVAPLE
jgi:hypothetical protein